MRFFFLTLFFCLLTIHARADFSPQEDQAWPIEGLSNPYDISQDQFFPVMRKGRIHALQYPVEVTGLKIPYNPTKEIFDDITYNPFRWIAQKMARRFAGVKSYDELMAWLGLNQYPQEEGDGPYYIPFPDGTRPSYRMGESFYDTENGKAFSLSCVACHSANLFGRPVLGLTNKRTRANEFMRRGVSMMKKGNSQLFAGVTSADRGERRMYTQTKKNAWFVESRTPSMLGLDTSLAHVALSLSHREKSAWAEKTKTFKRRPREEKLRDFVADSKPMPWWNVKYKNKWLSDGSVVAGNPILTNILWNEIGRGTDLQKLDQWFSDNGTKIKELTTAVFSAVAPRWTDYFPAESLDLDKAIKGQALFKRSCTKCHGDYLKSWEEKELSSQDFDHPEKSLFETKKVKYFKNTFVRDVGTDPQRWQGMSSLLQLNDLELSKKHGIKIKLQKGYVPPPLVGIWSRWPYMHNNSMGSLCEVLTVSSDRSKTFWTGPALDQNLDFDSSCVGFPKEEDVPQEWTQNRENLYDTSRSGQSNSGHDERIFIREGREIYSRDQKMQIIEFLKTL